MRILYVTASLPYGPGESFILPEIHDLQRRGHDIRVVPTLPRGPVVHQDAKPLRDSDLSQGLFSGRIAVATLRQAARNPGGLWRVARALAGSRSLKMLLKNLAVLPKSLWLAQQARVWNADHIHAHWLGTSATLALIASEMSGIPWSFTAHRWDIAENNLLPFKVTNASFARFINRRGIEMATELGVPPGSKMQVLHLGVEILEAPVVPASGPEGAEAPVAFCPANLLPVKGHRYLIEAMALLRDRDAALQLWLAGTGELLQELRHQVESLQLSDRVRFLGQLSHTDLLALYREKRITLTVMPSIVIGRYEHEGIPVSLIEAMSFGVPVVATETGGIPELLEGGAGLLVPHSDPQALAAAMERLLASPDLRAELSARGRQRVRDEFAIEVIGERLSRLFEQCVATQGGKALSGTRNA